MVLKTYKIFVKIFIIIFCLFRQISLMKDYFMIIILKQIKRKNVMNSIGCSFVLGLAAVIPLAGCGEPPDPMTGAGLDNPNPIVMKACGPLPDGREWGSTAGVDIDPKGIMIWLWICSGTLIS